MAEIKQLKEKKTDEIFYPVTVGEAVIFEDGTNLKDILEELCSPLIVKGTANNNEFSPNAGQPSANEVLTQFYKGRSIWIELLQGGKVQLKLTSIYEYKGVVTMRFEDLDFDVYWNDYSSLPMLEIDWNTPDNTSGNSKYWYGNYDLNDEQSFALKINDYDSNTIIILTESTATPTDSYKFSGGYYNDYNIRLIFNDPNVPSGYNYGITAYIEVS